VPWAAYIQDGKGDFHTLEHAEIIAMLNEQGSQNPDQINLEDAIRKMESAQEIRISV